MNPILAALWLSKPLRWALVGLGGFAALELYNMKQQSIGAERAAAKIEKANVNAANKGKAAADKSLSASSGVQRQRDPSTVD